MRLTVENDYGLRLVDYLKDKTTVTPASELAEALNMPLRFTLKILRKLNLSGITKAKRGTNGGYILNRPIEDVSYYDVIVAIQGPIYINRCLEDPEYCNLRRADSCPMHYELERIQTNLIRDLKKAKF